VERGRRLNQAPRLSRLSITSPGLNEQVIDAVLAALENPSDAFFGQFALVPNVNQEPPGRGWVNRSP
jgi:hypothetical protein